MKRLRLVIALTLLMAAFAAVLGMRTEVAFAVPETSQECNCTKAPTGAYGVLVYHMGEMLCAVEDCWIKIE